MKSHLRWVCSRGVVLFDNYARCCSARVLGMDVALFTIY